jgi:hypothetical protein
VLVCAEPDSSEESGTEESGTEEPRSAEPRSAEPQRADGDAEALGEAPESGWRAAYRIDEAELPRLTRGEMAWLREGNVETDELELLLVRASRARGGLDLAIAEGLLALKQGDRLAELGFHLDDYAREVLGIGETTARKLVRLASALRERPILKRALMTGEVRLRAAETILTVAVGDAEATWVERAARCTVRELEEAVRRVALGEDADEDWFRFRTYLSDEDRAVVDFGLELAEHVDAGPSRLDRMEAMAQEYLGDFAVDRGEDDTQRANSEFVRLGPGAAALRRDAARRAALEEDTQRWSILRRIPGLASPDVSFDALSTAQEVDAELRELAAVRERWDRIIGWCAYAIRRSGVATQLGFSSFRHYIEERLGLPPRAVEQREALERHLHASPALAEAQKQKVCYEKLRTLSRLLEHDIRSWIPRALALTCIELRRRVEGERERQMRVTRKLVMSLPHRVAALLAGAVHAVRERAKRFARFGKCLTIIAAHFIRTHEGAFRPARTRAQKVRERDGGHCQVPGCSHAADHAHHIEYRSRGGSDDESNQVSLCAFHHLRCIHGGFLGVTGTAPDGLEWTLRGERWNGGVVPVPVA